MFSPLTPNLSFERPRKAPKLHVMQKNKNMDRSLELAAVIKCLGDTDDPMNQLVRFHALTGRGRDSSYPLPPAQIRTSGITAYGSYLRS